MLVHRGGGVYHKSNTLYDKMSAIGAVATGLTARGVSARHTVGGRVSTGKQSSPVRASARAVVVSRGVTAKGLAARRARGAVGAAGLSSRGSAASMSASKAGSRDVNRRGLRVVARAAGSAPEGGDTRLGSGFARISADVRNQIRRNFTMLPVALICLLVGFSMCAFFPHPESPGDAAICFTIIFLAEFLSSVLYSPKRPRGMLKLLKVGKFVPLVLNCFKIGVLYGLCCDAFKVGS